MKKQQREAYQYVDQFRKISTLEKLPTLHDRFQNIFEQDAEKDNNNYMRFRKEPIVDHHDNPQHQNLILSNECVQEKVQNLLSQEKQKYEQEDARVRKQIHLYKQWSEANKDNKDRKQSYKFFYKNASPPKKISEVDTYDKKDNKIKGKTQSTDLRTSQDKETNDHDIYNLSNQKVKYDFKMINQKRMDDFLEKPQRLKNLQNEKEEDIFMLTFRKYEKYKTVQQIAVMDEYKIAEQDFYYDLNNQDQENLKLDQYFLNKFIYKSVAKSLKNTEKDVQYFRDLGLPSRNLDAYTKTMSHSKTNKQLLEQQTKQQAHFLHLLRESELNINKNDINFDDISNISNGRVTCLNAYMCIRSEKVTKAQFEKLLKKLDKYKKQEMEKGKEKVEIGIWTQDIQIENTSPSNQKQPIREQKNSINQLINQIGQIRQSTILLKTTKQNDSLHIRENPFKKQKFTRMEILLKKLYDKIITNPTKYPFTFLEEHLESIDQLLLEQYKDGKILWFILDCYEEIIKNLPNQDNIKTVLKKKPIAEPKLTLYKGSKIIKEQKLKVTNLYTYKDRSKSPMVPTNDRFKIKNRTSVTPTKTQVKKPVYGNPSTSNFSRTRY